MLNAIASVACLFLALALGLLQGWRLWEALQTGTLPNRGSAYEVTREPVAFWLAFVFEALCLLALAALAIWSAIKLIALAL